MTLTPASILARLQGNALVRSTMRLLMTRGVSIILGLFSSALLARWLGPAGYGSYFFTVTLASFLALPILAGLPTVMIREIAIARGDDDGALIKGVILWAVRFFVVMGLIIGLAGYLILFLLPTGIDLPPIYLLALPLVVGLGAMKISAAVLQGFEQPFLGNLPDTIIRPALILVLAFVVISFASLTPSVAIGLHITAACLAFVWAFIVSRKIIAKSGISLSDAPAKYSSKRWLLSLIPLSLITASTLLSNRIDVLMLGVLTDTTQVALYGIAMQISGLVAMGQTIVNGIVQPKIARLYSRDETPALKRTLTQGARLSAGLAILVMAVILIFGESVVGIVYGDAFLPTVMIMIILSAGRVLNALFGPVGVTMNMTGYMNVAARITIVFVFVNVVLNYVLIPLYGGIGAAIATVVSLFSMHLYMAITARRSVKLDTTVLGVHPAPAGSAQ